MPYIQPHDWVNMSQEEQQSILTTRGTLRQVESAVTDAQDQFSMVSTTAGMTHPPPVITNISQVSSTLHAPASGSAFGGRAAYRHP